MLCERLEQEYTCIRTSYAKVVVYLDDVIANAESAIGEAVDALGLEADKRAETAYVAGYLDGIDDDLESLLGRLWMH
jgi:hypothetical protein